jgi:hypothetical protein
MKVGITGIGVQGQGLESWPATAAVLDGRAQYDASTGVPDPDAILGALRRRTSVATRLAVGASHEALKMSGLSANEVSTVFGSSNGSVAEIHHLLEALAEPEMAVSPTKFHNSVHNAAVGYWCIASGAHQPSTSIACHDYSFAAALIKATAQVVTESNPVLLCVFDAPFPEPLNEKRPIAPAIAISLILVPETLAAPNQIELSVQWDQLDPPFETTTGLDDMANGNPAGAGLRLLDALARKTKRAPVPYLRGSQIGISLWQS